MDDEIGSRSESKWGKKQSSGQFGEKLERCKRVKLQDLDSICRSKEMIESSRRFLSVDKEKSQELHKDDANSFSHISQTKITNKMPPQARDPGIISLDLNTEIHEPNNMTIIDHKAIFDQSKGFNWDLNTDKTSNPPGENNFKKREYLRSSEISECGSTTGPSDDKDPMKVWREMKKNGFLSSAYISIKEPKQKGRNNKIDGFKKKMEIAKKEQVDRFAKIAAPSGLLNDLNPGIINHVRNRKQVHSIIEALVRLEKKENNNQGVGKQAVFPERDGDFNREKCFFDKNSFPLIKKQIREDDVLGLKLASSTTMGSEEISSLSYLESANLGTISSLSVKAASVAFQWLELLQQDINGRLLALRRSKKRVQSVISTELPLIMSREFSNNQENDSHYPKENVEAHQAKWGALFDQMDKTLNEEEKQLEMWLRQVIEMQFQCEKGLHSYSLHGSQQPGTSETHHRFEEVDKSERELAVTAAAASIYSTCNFLLSSENLPCF